MYHWVAIVGACLALVGTLVLGFELLTSKSSEEVEKKFRASQDAIANSVGQVVTALNATLATQSGFFSGYLKNLELDMKPVFKPLLDNGDKDLERTIALRHDAIGEFDKAQMKHASSVDLEGQLGIVRAAQRSIEEHFATQTGMAKRMRLVAGGGIVLVGLGAVFQLVDALLKS
jgi:hypothetical protein